MVDAQALKDAVVDQLFDVSVISFENVLVLDVQANQTVDGEEAAVVDALIGFVPLAQPVMLFFRDTQQQRIVSVRFVDATTAERVVSVSADGSVRKGGGFIRGASLSRENEWGIASEAIEAAAKAVVEKLTTGGALAKVSRLAIEWCRLYLVKTPTSGS
jgi:hypothetical protein